MVAGNLPCGAIAGTVWAWNYRPMNQSTTRCCSTLPLGPAPGAGEPCEVVVLQSVSAGGGFSSTAVRSWVSALDGTGLEADTTDPVAILTGAGDDLASFHDLALAELYRRRRFDFEVADLFAVQIP